jgi:predicted RNase H-like nuclease (RuvC/YqgF family)
METPIIVAIIGVLAAPVAAFVTWFINRKKHIADIYSALSESSQTVVETMQITMHELRIELTEAREKIDNLVKENVHLREDMKELKNFNIKLLDENQKLKSQLDGLTETMKRLHASDSESE